MVYFCIKYAALEATQLCFKSETPDEAQFGS